MLNIFMKKAIRNIFHYNIDVHRRMLIAELPGYRVKCISKLHSHCANMNFADKSRYDNFFQQATYKEGEYVMIFFKDSKIYRLCQF